MQLQPMKQLGSLNYYQVEIVPFRGGYMIQLRRSGSEMVLSLETKRGEIRQFKTWGAAMRVAVTISENDIVVINPAGYRFES